MQLKSICPKCGLYRYHRPADQGSAHRCPAPFPEDKGYDQPDTFERFTVAVARMQEARPSYRGWTELPPNRNGH